MKINTNVRNAAIVVLLAAVVYAFGTTGDFALSTLVTAIVLAFFGAMAWIAAQLYREHRTELYSLGERRRAVAYAALGVAALALTAVGRFTASGLGTVIWIVLLGVCIYALYSIWRSTREN